MKKAPNQLILIWGLLFAALFLTLSLRTDPRPRDVPADVSPQILEIANQLVENRR